MKLLSKAKPGLFLVLLFIIGLSLRLYGLNWDQGHHLHPDERFLTMVLNDIKLPSSVQEYFSTHTSPLNPYNYPSFNFFVYGTFPIFFTKYLASLYSSDSYDKVYLFGRGMSALFDSFNIILLYFISLKVFGKNKLSFLPGILYAFCVLPLQLSHFFAVDTFLSFFILLTFTLLVYDKFLPSALAFGLALACKVSAVIFVPVIGLFVLKKNN